MSRMKRGYGYVPDLPDFRDHQFGATNEVATNSLPSAVDLRPQCPDVVDQGQLGSCVGNASANAVRFDLMRQKAVSFLPSRLFVYYNARALEGTTKSDSGCQIRDAVKSISKLGACPETSWPYTISKFATKPTAASYRGALAYTAVEYLRVTQTTNDIRTCLAAGFPVLIGISVYDSFESAAVAKSGLVPMPKAGESQLGGHCMLVVGYDDASQRYIVMNSWGARWGMKGFCTLPYAYLINTDLAADFWTLRAIAASTSITKKAA